MATDQILTFAARDRARAGTLAEISFACFLLLVFIGLKPFALRDISLLPSGSSGTVASSIVTVIHRTNDARPNHTNIS